MRKIILFALLFVASAVYADTIKIVVPFAAGGPADRTARVLERILTAKTPHNYVLEYRVGAGGSVSANYVSTYRGPETVLLVHSLALVINSLPTDATYSLTNFEPVATLGSIQLALITNTNSRVNTMQKLLATKDPVFFGSSGIGAATHVAGELFGKETGVNMTHVPYKGEPAALADILGNNIDTLFAAVSVAQNHPFTVLAVTGTKRSKEFPKVPTFQEQGIKGFEINPNWYVLVANPTADQHTLAMIKAALGVALREDPTVFSQAGVDTNRSELYNTQQFLVSEQQRMRRLLDKIKSDNK
jgi:tripartite-type tricarboxylate transporter receptor subunit TctC